MIQALCIVTSLFFVFFLVLPLLVVSSKEKQCYTMVVDNLAKLNKIKYDILSEYVGAQDCLDEGNLSNTEWAKRQRDLEERYISTVQRIHWITESGKG